ncbi:hypothetical protein BGY98DRAFT_972097 [Russula aff. rugulosa BPL654]|nr:hypothetical protein BGY98DRAFT_972097 [Russula aff. rugulosa BPL654]
MQTQFKSQSHRTHWLVWFCLLASPSQAPSPNHALKKITCYLLRLSPPYQHSLFGSDDLSDIVFQDRLSFWERVTVESTQQKFKNLGVWRFAHSQLHVTGQRRQPPYSMYGSSSRGDCRRDRRPLVIAALWAIANRLPVSTFPIIAWVAAAILSDTVNNLPAIGPASLRPIPRSTGATMGTTTLLMMIPTIWDAASV